MCGCGLVQTQHRTRVGKLLMQSRASTQKAKIRINFKRKFTKLRKQLVSGKSSRVKIQLLFHLKPQQGAAENILPSILELHPNWVISQVISSSVSFWCDQAFKFDVKVGMVDVVQ